MRSSEDEEQQQGDTSSTHETNMKPEICEGRRLLSTMISNAPWDGSGTVMYGTYM